MYLESTLKRYYAVITKYKNFIQWYLPDTLFRYRKDFSLILILSICGIVFQALTFGAIIYYANLLASGNHLVADLYLVQIGFNPRESLELLLFTSIATVVCLSLASMFIYYARTKNIRMGRRYNEFCIERLLELVARYKQPLQETSEGNFVDEKYLMRLMIGDARLCGRVLRIVLDMIVPFITLLFTFAVLLYLNVALTLIILLFMSGYVLIQGYISLSGAKDTKKFEGYTPLVRKILNDLLKQKTSTIDFLHKNSTKDKRSYRTLADRVGAISSQFNAFEGRVRATEQSRLLSGLFMATMTGLLIFIFGNKIITSGIGWGELLVYIVALKLGLTSLQIVFGQLTTVNRFYPQIQRYRRFVCAYFNQSSSSNQELVLPSTLIIEDPLITGGDLKLTINSGGLISIVAPFVIDKYNYAHLLSQIAEISDYSINVFLDNTLFICSNNSLEGYSLRQIFSLKEKDHFSQISLSKISLDELIKKIPSLDSGIDRIQWESLSNKLKSLLLLSSVKSCMESLILIDYELIQELSSDVLISVRKDLNKKMLLIVHQSNESFEPVNFLSDYILISSGEKIIAGGGLAWFRKRRAEILMHMSQYYPIKQNESRGSPGDVEDYD